MKPFAERKPFLVGLSGIALTAGIAVVALNYDKLPLSGDRARAVSTLSSTRTKDGTGDLRSGEIARDDRDGDVSLSDDDVLTGRCKNAA